MDPREIRLNNFIAMLNSDEYRLIQKFLELRSDYLDSQRGLKPWKESNDT